MPAFYAHDRFGKKVAERLPKTLQQTVKRHYRQYRIGLQGPDLFFFYQPYRPKPGDKNMEIISMIFPQCPFSSTPRKVVRKRGESSREYAYLMGFVCHFILDSECHPYVEKMIHESGISHSEIEMEFDRLSLKGRLY